MSAELKQARLAQDLRLIDVASTAGLSVSLVSMVERGAPCSTQAKDKLARALGASYGSFWQDFEAGETHMLAGAAIDPRPERRRRRGIGT